MADGLVVSKDRITDGVWQHTGRLIISCRLDTGEVITVTLPDDLRTVLAATTTTPSSLEDLTHGG